MVNIEINGISIQARDGAMVIEAADEAGITIPRFCYHKKLSIAANCRMCLVEVEKVAKPLPACATPVTEGMKVFTRSPKAISAQRGVMEFLLINHPLDCPICDQGGECQLQEMAMGFGNDVSQYHEGKRAVQDKNLGPLVATDMTRCIHCTRCVRFGQEIAGIMELGATGRGEHMTIGTYVEKSVDSELSGNVIDLCPVGALTSKPFRYKARPWELTSHEGISPHDCVGSNLVVQVRRGQVMRVLPRENEAVNETWISDRDRFSYTALDHSERLRKPMIKMDGEWKEVDWDTALTHAVEGLKRILEEQGSGQLGALGGYSSTTEELYLLQKLARGLGCGNIDHRLRQQDFSDESNAPVFPWVGQSLEDLQLLDGALVVGSNVRKEQPMVNHRLRKAALGGAAISFVNPLDYESNFPTAERLISSPAGMVRDLAAIAKVLLEGDTANASQSLSELTKDVEPAEAHRRVAESLQRERTTVLIGNVAAYHPNQADIRALCGFIAQTTKSALGYLPEGGNSAGAWLSGAVPHRDIGGRDGGISGLNWRKMFDAGLKAYLLLGVEPELDCIDSAAAFAAMKKADFVVALTPYASQASYEYADILLPTALYPETSGTFVNAEGRWQSFNGAVAPVGDARPAWKLLRVMGNLFDVPGFEYMSAEEIRQELEEACASVVPRNDAPWAYPKSPPAVPKGLVRVADFPIYAVDAMVRRADPLQQTVDGNIAAIRANRATIQRAGLADAAEAKARQNENEVTLPLIVDERVPDDCVYIAAGHAATVGLGNGFAPVELSRV